MRTAVSSSVSVPWVTTTPRPLAASAAAARAISSASVGETCTPGQLPSVRARRPGTAASAGTAATSASASSSGTAPPWPAMAIVPPAASTVTSRTGAMGGPYPPGPAAATARRRPRRREP